MKEAARLENCTVMSRPSSWRMREAYTQASSEDDILKDIKLRHAAGALTGEGNSAGRQPLMAMRRQGGGVPFGFSHKRSSMPGSSKSVHDPILQMGDLVIQQGGNRLDIQRRVQPPSQSSPCMYSCS